MRKAVQAKDITDDEIMAVARAEIARRGFSTRYTTARAMSQYPDKVVNAKLRSLDKRGLIVGYCPCGCSGVFWLPGEQP